MICYVEAGQCGIEVIIKVVKKTNTTASIEVETNCEYVKNLAKNLREIKVGEEFTLPIIKTKIYKTASKHLCRTSCVVPAAILKALEVEFGIFPPHRYFYKIFR